MHSMAEWYMRGEQHDQGRLSRILDVAQDLKVSGRTSSWHLDKILVSLQIVFLCMCCSHYMYVNNGLIFKKKEIKIHAF